MNLIPIRGQSLVHPAQARRWPGAILVFAGFLTGQAIMGQGAPEQNAAAEKALRECDVTWTALGNYSADSMPLGNGDIGMNVWTEQNGDVLFYISKTDAWTENAKGKKGLAKVGRIRVSVSPNPFFKPGTFSQALRLENGSIEIKGGSGTDALTMRIWVDANRPVVRVETTSASPVAVNVEVEPWRATPENQLSADVVMPPVRNELAWYHRDAKPVDPHVQNLTFGAAVKGDGFVAKDERTLRAEPSARQVFSIYPFTAKTDTPEDWRAKLDDSAARADATSLTQARQEHEAWWRDYWNRSWIYPSGDASAAQVAQGYQLQRFVTACAGRGAYPVKFNGTIFTVDAGKESQGKDKKTGLETFEEVDADFRAWGGQYWFQNTRPMYWPRLMAGDFDEMLPLFHMYQAMIPENEALVQKYYGHGGVYFAETAPFWGGMDKLPAEGQGSYTQHYFTDILELSAMMLDYYAYTGDEKFVKDTLLPVANAGLEFFSEHFKRDDKGKLLLEPDNSIEMFWKVRNPLPDIAGLHYVLARLKELPANLADAPMRANWDKLISELPPVPMGTKDGKQVLLPYEAGQEAKQHNSENPELYAIYPFRLYGLGKPDLQMARDSFDLRAVKRTGCWHQDPVQSALLGMAALARKDITFNLTNKDPRLHFPAFWQRGHDYEPDEDNGGNGENGLQHMIMQADNGKITLLPAWPKGWNVAFKLHAPANTTVEGFYRDGKMQMLKVTPESRAKDVTVLEAQ